MRVDESWRPVTTVVCLKDAIMCIFMGTVCSGFLWVVMHKQRSKPYVGDVLAVWNNARLQTQLNMMWLMCSKLHWCRLLYFWAASTYVYVFLTAYTSSLEKVKNIYARHARRDVSMRKTQLQGGKMLLWCFQVDSDWVVRNLKRTWICSIVVKCPAIFWCVAEAATVGMQYAAAAATIADSLFT